MSKTTDENLRTTKKHKNGEQHMASLPTLRPSLMHRYAVRIHGSYQFTSAMLDF
jgi:hypothetical protein